MELSNNESEILFLEKQRDDLLSLIKKLELLGVNVEPIKIADKALLEKIDKIKSLCQFHDSMKGS